VPAEAFKFYMPVTTWAKADDEHGMRIGGIVSTDGLDRQGERVVQDGLDFTPFVESGWFNDNHGQRTADVLGYPTDVQRVKKGEQLPNGTVSDCNGWWAEGYLMNTDEGKRIYALAQSLSTGGKRQLGFSIEGKVTARDRKDKTRIVRAEVINVAVTHCPVNTETHLHALAKALTAGSSIANTGATPGNGFALRGESIDRKPGTEDEDEDEATLTVLSESGDGGEPDNGGVGGISPHKVVKSDNQHASDVVTTWDYVMDWSDAMQTVRTDNEPPMLTKSEAAVIVTHRYPHLSANDVDAIIAKAGG
tara:strand:+ start:6064 stop:6981 length:918 start_codon:yes stop_codon:yes gene_type:complete